MEDTWYTFTGRVITSTGPGDNNGAYRYWIDDTQVLDVSGKDNDLTIIDKVIVGAAGSAGITSYTIECDDVIVRLTEIARPGAPSAFPQSTLAQLGAGI